MKAAEKKLNPLELMKSAGKFVSGSGPESFARCIVVDGRTGEVSERFIPFVPGEERPVKSSGGSVR